MNIEITSLFEDLTAGWQQANKVAISNLIKRCVVKNVLKKESLNSLLEEVNNWDGRTI